MGYKAVRNAIQTKLNTITAVEPTSYKVHERMPESLNNADGYSIIVKPPSSAFTPANTSQCADSQVWLIDVYSPDANTGFRSDHEDRLLDYGDLIVDLFASVRTLPAEGVTGVKLSGLRFNDGDYPINASVAKYHFQVQLTVEFSRARAC